jgi:hypothetical protein
MFLRQVIYSYTCSVIKGKELSLSSHKMETDVARRVTFLVVRWKVNASRSCITLECLLLLVAARIETRHLLFEGIFIAFTSIDFYLYSRLFIPECLNTSDNLNQTPISEVLLQKLGVSQLVKKFPTCCGIIRSL